MECVGLASQLKVLARSSYSVILAKAFLYLDVPIKRNPERRAPDGDEAS